MWPESSSGGIALLHGLAEIPHNVRRGVSISGHVAVPDKLAPPEEIDGREAGIAANTYPNVGYTDETSSDYDAATTEHTWERVLRVLNAIASP